MSAVYEVAHISKQALHQHRIRSIKKATEAYKFFDLADKERIDHPGVGCRKLANKFKMAGWGRDKVEHLLLDNGYRLYYPPNYTRTTYSQSDILYPNLIEGMELTAINQVVQTDITYYKVGDRNYYIVFLIDVYSREIVGHGVSKTLEAKGNISALKKLFNYRLGHSLTSLIHHSDRGSQYIDLEYRALLQSKGIKPSMCKAAWENAYTERVNRTLKEEYLDRWNITSYRQLVSSVNKAVNHYNHKRWHQSLGNVSPASFAKHVEKLPIDQRPKHVIYKRLESNPQNECE